MRYRFHDRLFNSEQELIQILLMESNEWLTKIERTELQNTHENRMQIAFRLRAISHYIDHPSFENVKHSYNSCWRQVYWLEHSVCFRHPYLQYIIQKVDKMNGVLVNEKATHN